MFNKNIFLKAGKSLIVVITLCASFTCLAEYKPFPGKHSARLISVGSANTVTLNFETWPGYAKTISVTLPNLVLPGYTMQPPTCELELAQKAQAFTEQFMQSATKISFDDLRMETSADEYGTANVSTEQGSLAAALKKEGLARSESVDSEEPWCK